VFGPQFVTAIPQNNSSSNNLRIAITGTLVVHALLFLLLAWIFARDVAMKLLQEANQPPKEKEVMLLFPDQILPPLPPPPPKPKQPQVYIRTAQNESADTAPKNAAFIADRNTNASTTKAPSPDATDPLPSMDGIKLQTRELADRDFHNGDLKDDARKKSQQPDVAMRPPQPMVPPTPPTAIPEPKPPQTASTQQPQTVAKTAPEATPLTKMMEEADKELAKVDKNRLPFDLKKPEVTKTQAPEKTQETPPKAIPLDPMTLTPAPPKPEMVQSTPPETPPQKPIPKALPVVDDEVITKTTRNTDPNAFTPFTRRSQTKGTVSSRGMEDSVDAKATPMGRYYRQVVGQVEKKWHLYLHLRRDGVTYGNLDIVFYVSKKGKVEGLRVLNDKESNPILTELTVRAIQDAEIPPIPEDVIPELPEEDHGRFKINYDVHIY
jgi:outer membrane biosynthesis protein TonB